MIAPVASVRLSVLPLFSVDPNRLRHKPKSNPTERSRMLAPSYRLRITTAPVVLKHPSDRCRDALSLSARQKEVSMHTLKHISAGVIAAALASAIVVDTADARFGGGGGFRGGGMRVGGFGGGGVFRGGAMRVGGFGGGGLRTAGFNRGGAFAGNRFANAGFVRRADFGRPGWRWAGGGWGGRWASGG